MGAIPKPKTPTVLPWAIRGPGRHRPSAPGRGRTGPPVPAALAGLDLALIATFCVTGIREAEAVGLDVGSLSGEPGARRLEVVGKGGKARPIPDRSAPRSGGGGVPASERLAFPPTIWTGPPRPCSLIAGAAG